MIPRLLILLKFDPLELISFEVARLSRPILFLIHGVLLGSSVMTRAVSPLLQTVVLHPLVLLLATEVVGQGRRRGRREGLKAELGRHLDLTHPALLHAIQRHLHRE